MSKQPPKYDANQYAAFRPQYPDKLFTEIYAHVSTFDMAWDCACGSGQATQALAKKFKHVFATDISDTQIAAAPNLENVEYTATAADHTSLADESVDLITVAQAMHWFANDDFFDEAKRVLKPDGIIAAWCYHLVNISPEIDALARYYADEILKGYWAFGRHYINERYTTIPFPFQSEYFDEFYSEKMLGFNDLIGYLESFSPRKPYMEKTGIDPINEIKPKLAAAWGDIEKKRFTKFPIYLLIGK